MFKETKTYRPFHYPWAVELTQMHDIDMHWHEKEVNLIQDVQQWNDGTISDPEKNFITNVLRLFTQSDVAVGGMYKDLLIPWCENNEISNMLTSFAAREGVHQRAYALIPETLKFPDSEWHAFLEYKEMADKWELMDGEITDVTCLAELFSKQVFLEGVSLFGSFAMLLAFKQQAKMLGMCEVVEWSIRDETVHVEVNAKLFKTYCAENPEVVTDSMKRNVYSFARKVVACEDAFIDAAFKLHTPEGITAQSVKRYIRYLADRRLIQLGLKGNWKVKEVPEELEWLQWTISAPRVSNFFERRVTDYLDSSMTGEINWSNWSN